MILFFFTSNDSDRRTPSQDVCPEDDSGAGGGGAHWQQRDKADQGPEPEVQHHLSVHLLRRRGRGGREGGGGGGDVSEKSGQHDSPRFWWHTFCQAEPYQTEF